ncbi:MAG: MtrB/PioB family outer membrane beta-barrel protein, partial [Betaproteobacteria bacterium]|nr:MtrB/PioB family outer membrane beta-barrel protein [Betaproteobacteria bacterium]
SYSAEYWLAPIQRLDLRAFFRRFDLDNETPASQWQYVTQDVSNLNGTVAYVNKRVSEPIAWDRQNTGVDATWRFGVWRGSLGFGFEREEIGREHREAEQTSENVLRASSRARPLSWLSLRAKYLRGDRDGGTYDWRVPRESYWYAATEATDNNNPQFTFENHPDMRRYDISDRRRDRVDFTAALTTGGPFSLATTFTYWRDDFDADVEPEQPLLGRPVADSLATTPGDQLGLLRSEVRQFGLDLAYAPAGRISLNASLGYDAGESSQRGIEFNENNKQNPSAVATATLGPWNRASSQWTADFDGHTRYAGVGGTYDIVPGRVSLSANYTLSLSDIEIDYAGYGVTNFDGTPFPPDHEFSFQTPPPVRHDSHVGDLSLDFPLVRNIGARLGYSYESYKIRDWQQETQTPQFESVGTELLLRDTSRSHQWGNRLFNVGAVLAPGYTAHVVYASLRYDFGAKPIVATLLQ